MSVQLTTALSGAINQGGTITATPTVATVPRLVTDNADLNSDLNAQAQALANTDAKIIAESTDGALHGMVADGLTDSTAALVAQVPNGLTLPAGTSRVGNAQISSGQIVGRGPGSVLKATSGAATVLKLGYSGTPSLWAPKPLRDFTIDGNSKASNGVTYGDTATTQLAGRWVLDCMSFTQCDKAIYKPNGNIGNAYRSLSLSNSNFGYYAVGQASPIMQAGSDIFEGGEANSCELAAFYIDSPVGGTGGTAWKGTIIEGNPGFGIFLKNWFDSYTPIVMDGVWWEVNATAASVTIDGTSYTPRDLRMDNVAYAIIRGSMVPKSLEMNNSRLWVDGASINDGPNVHYYLDSSSVIEADGIKVDGGTHPMEVRSLVASVRPSGNQAAVFWSPPRTLRGAPAAAKLQALTYQGAGPFPFTGSTSVNGTSVADGRSTTNCCELTIPSGATLTQPAVTITAGNWYVVTFDAKLVSGTTTGLTFGALGTTPLFANAEQLMRSDWRTIATVSKAGVSGAVQMFMINSTGGAVTLRLAAWQIMEFTSEQEAISYYNGMGAAL